MRIFIVLIIIFLFYFLQSNIYTVNCFKNVTADVKFALNGIFEGEDTSLIQIILNKKLMPLWWVTAKFKVSKNLIFVEESLQNNVNNNYRQDFYSIMPYERVTKTLNIIAGKRGYYKVEQIELHSGDLFGLHKIIASYNSKANIYVYPKLIIPQELNVNFRSLTGEIITKRNIVEDPFELRGIRDYNPFDSIKDVNWTATAKTLELKVNEYNFTASQEVTIFLNVDKYNSWDSDNLIEEGIRLAASLITQYLKQGMKVGLKVNGCDCLTGDQINLPSVYGTNQNLYFYESLARLDTKKVTAPISTILKEEQIKQNKVPLWIVISHYFGADLQYQINNSRVQGFDVKMILIKETNTKVEIVNHSDLFVWEVK